MNRKFKILIIIVLLIGLLGSGWMAYKLYNRHQARKRAEELARNLKRPEIRVTIVEGWDNKRINKYLSETFGANPKLIEVGLKNTQGLEFVSNKKISSLEGFIFPDTYNLFDPFDINEFVTKTLQNFYDKFTEATKDKLPSEKGYTFSGFGNLVIDPYDAVIIASIIEKEAGADLSKAGLNKERLLEERRTIAGIFYNRLQSGMALESDATINYITGKSASAASAKDLEIDSPYNTYKYADLPPTPISNPSYSSLYAALHPIKTDYYFFLHKQPSGEIVYSKTFDEHVQNKFKYLK